MMMYEKDLQTAIDALCKIAAFSRFKEDPEYTAERSYGNYDDCYQDGYDQAEYEVAAIAREALKAIEATTK